MQIRLPERVVLLAVQALWAACTFDTSGLSPSAAGQDARGWQDARAGDAARDRNESADSLLDAPSDQAAVDLTAGDLTAGDQLADASNCGVILDPQTLMLLDFEGIVSADVPDLTGKHPGTLVGGQITPVVGPGGCGTALHIPAALSGGSYIEVADHDDWDLAQGSVDLWVRFDTPTGGTSHQGILSRDASGENEPGHFTLFRSCGGSVVVRLQDDTGTYYQCSAPVTEGQWIHVGVNFGGAMGLQLFLDGQQATQTAGASYGDSTNPCGVNDPCGTSTTGGIAGNSNPWVIGASAMDSQDGQAGPVTMHLGGAIDQVRISSARRDFSM